MCQQPGLGWADRPAPQVAKQVAAPTAPSYAIAEDGTAGTLHIVGRAAHPNQSQTESILTTHAALSTSPD